MKKNADRGYEKTKPKQTQSNPILSADLSGEALAKSEALAKAASKPPIFDFICFQLSYRIWAIIVRHKRMNRKLIKMDLSSAVIVLKAIFANRPVYLRRPVA